MLHEKTRYLWDTSLGCQFLKNSNSDRKETEAPLLINSNSIYGAFSVIQH